MLEEEFEKFILAHSRIVVDLVNQLAQVKYIRANNLRYFV